MRAVAAALGLVLAMAGVAAGDGSKLLVLQSEGRADGKARAKIDATILKLARAGTDTVTPSEITYSDAAALVGCKPDDAPCKDEVIGSLGVDEIVITTVTPKPGGLEVSVRRIGRNGATRDATMTVAADKTDRLDAIATLFVAKPVGPTPPPITTTTTVPPATTTVPPATVPFGPMPPPATTVPAITTEPPPNDPIGDPAKQTTTPPAKPLDQPAGNIDESRERRRNRLRIAGMAGGGGLFLLGLVLWGNASGIENDVNNAVVRSQADLDDLKALESRGDRYARWGNVFVLGGLALGGVSTYFFVKARRAKHTPTTAIVPVLFDHGGGIGLSFGGGR
jgi:hypothetical protein